MFINKINKRNQLFAENLQSNKHFTTKRPVKTLRKQTNKSNNKKIRFGRNKARRNDEQYVANLINLKPTEIHVFSK
jgi:hypothetical protein